MKNSLSARFLVITVVVLLAALIVWKIPPKLGIDLAGGTSLTYELDLSKLKSGPGGDPADLAERVVAVLKRRVDPYGQKNLIWRVIGGKRIQVQMPLADKETREARDELQKAEQALREKSLRTVEIQGAIAQTGAARTDAINKLAPAGSPRNDLIVKLATARDTLTAAEQAEAKFPVGQAPGKVLAQVVDARKNYAAAKEAIDATNVDFTKLMTLIAATENPKNKTAHGDLDAFVAQYPAEKELLNRIIEAHDQLSTHGGGLSDPTELQRLVTAAGVLDFRITVDPNSLGGVTGNDYQQAVQSLQQHGPQQEINFPNIKARWFQVDTNSQDNFTPRAHVISEWGGEMYVLMYDDLAHTLTHDSARMEWSVTASDPMPDPENPQEIILPFKMDSVGSHYLSDLTSSNIEHPMGILLDDKAVTAPTIRAVISDSGTISFGRGSDVNSAMSGAKEAENLKQIMDSGSLPATLQREPISIVEITPDLGADNISAGLRSAVYAMIAVVAFMVIYYTITGLFADLALCVNLLLVLAAMAILGGTFTLPGIAGLVLTLGMAVDANVLINERIREELHKGASLAVAVKQGYDKVFWTIFDANLTTSLTSIVLIYVGSEEVKGFGVTLLIGLLIHMFTALYASRTLMMGAIKIGIVRAIDDHSLAEYFREIFTFTWLRNGHWPFMRVITVTNIDWIGKRYIFWAISTLVTIAGLVAFVARGEDKYDIEFRGGTQVTFQLKPGADMTLEQIRDKVRKIADEPGLKEVEDARVYGVGKPEEHRYEMQTTVNDSDTVKLKNKLLDALATQLKDVLDVTRAVTIKGGDIDDHHVTELMDRKIILPITKPTLDQDFAGSGVADIPNRDVTDQMNGVAILLDNIQPPQTAQQLLERITTARQSSDPTIANIPFRKPTIIPVMTTEGPATEDDKRLLTKAVYVTIDENLPYSENTEAMWKERVASAEWQVLKTALSTESLFKGVTSFDAVVASQAKWQAVEAILLSLMLIVAYVWIRFGGIRYGLGAILSLAHDAVVAVAATVLSGEVYNHIFGGHSNPFLITDFKINLTMIAAYLTIIGYSVNDTIVIFDRVRELRGRSQTPLTGKLVNDAINQCFGRTIWTTFTVFIVVLIMYIFGGEGIRGFSFAMLIGVITGAYSTLAIASPMLLSTGTASAATSIEKVNPFLKREETASQP